MKKKKPAASAVSVIVGILFAVLAVWRLAGLSAAQGGGRMGVLLWAGGYLLAAAALFWGRQGKLLLFALSYLLSMGVGEFVYDLDEALFYYEGFPYVLPALLALVGHLALMVLGAAVITGEPAAWGERLRGLWFLPAAFLILALLLGLAVQAFHVQWLLVAVAYLFLALWLCSPEMDEGYCDLATHALLLVFTFGIWYLIWVYRRTRYLNRMEEKTARGAVRELLLCLFIPFYQCFWTYQSARRLQRLSRAREVECESPVLYLGLSLLGIILAPIFLQDQLNTLHPQQNH